MTRTLAGALEQVLPHTHADSSEGGQLDESAIKASAAIAVLTRTAQQSFSGPVVATNLSALSLNVGTGYARFIVGTDGGITMFDGTYLHTLTWVGATNGYALTWPNHDGPLSTNASPRAYVAKTANYTAAVTDEVIFCDATSGAITISLPPAATAGAGKVYAVKKTDASGNAVTLDGDGTEKIDGALTKALAAQYDSVTIVSDGANWGIIA